MIQSNAKIVRAADAVAYLDSEGNGICNGKQHERSEESGNVRDKLCHVSDQQLHGALHSVAQQIGGARVLDGTCTLTTVSNSSHTRGAGGATVSTSNHRLQSI